MTDSDKDFLKAELPPRAVRLAAEILNASRKIESSSERSRSALMARMMEDEPGKKFTIAMADQVLRIKNPQRAAQRMNSLILEYGIPEYFSSLDRIALRMGNRAAGLLPNSIMPFVTSKVRKDSEHVIISAEDKEFSDYLRQRNRDKIRVNFNQLGEAVLGNQEASRRLHDNEQRLLEPGIDYLSVKLSSIVSQISLTGYRQTLESIKPRLRAIYRAAIKGGGKNGSKFVNLDMEEYRDLHLTVDVFCEVLDESEFENLEAGIVLQAYLPDSYLVLQSLLEWARSRYGKTGAGIKIRLVKGANLAMETVEASVKDWEQAPYYTKLEVDANYKRMLEYATRPEYARIVRVGVGSHNLFDIAYALLLREKRGVQDCVEFEMLEGMANAQALEVRDRSGGLIVYAPVVLDAEFEAAVAYLVRRLDENTEPGSFLGALFGLQEGSPQWTEQKDAFLHSCSLASDSKLIAGPNRTQNRLTENTEPNTEGMPFHNAPDTDFSLPANRQWATEIIEQWKEHVPAPIPLQIGGAFRSEKMTGVAKDPSRPGHDAYRFAQADAADIEMALTKAVEAQQRWGAKSVSDRATVLRRVGAVLAQKRKQTIGAMLLDAGKNIIQADVEVSEAIDFANYYAQGLDEQGWFDGTVANPLGVVVITPPWNFPFAIPAGGVLAALMAGNSVILKPAREAVLTAWMLAEQCWEAGVPKDVLQFAPTLDGATGKLLVNDPRTAAVILTGSIFTAQLFQSWRPRLRLFAETSGKNCMIVSAAADLDLAVKDIVDGAFGHAGQKCSATSLAIVQAEVHDDPLFLRQLKDAAESLTIGGSWNPSSLVTPVIREPDEYLHRGLTQLDAGESWLLEPKIIDNNPCHWSPGIRMGVRPGSWYHKTECFGPVLGLIRVESFGEAIAIQNSGEFGLTGGLHSLDPAEVKTWREKVEVGNAYINRTTTGAIVRRQPFGGWKDSCVGPGAKAGGPSYVASLSNWLETGLPALRKSPDPVVLSLVNELSTRLSDEESRRLVASAESYTYWWDKEFSKEHDPSQIHGETNDFRYRARRWHLLRLNSEELTNVCEIFQLAVACLVVGTQLQISVANSVDWNDVLARNSVARVIVESEDQLIGRLKRMKDGTLRIKGRFDENKYAPHEIGNIPLLETPVMANGRIELLNYLKEQSVSETVHRYGNIV